jgi:hypothetical protein
MTSLEVLSSRTYADLLIRTCRSKLSSYPRLSLRPHRCLSHLARHWPAVRRDLLLRSSFFSQWPPAAFLVTADLLGVWLLLDACGFRPVLARGWHGSASSSRTVGTAESLIDATSSLGRCWLLRMAPTRAGCCTSPLYSVQACHRVRRQGHVDTATSDHVSARSSSLAFRPAPSGCESI